jgi:N-acetylglucosamine-6-phosphate deacetylase
MVSSRIYGSRHRGDDELLVRGGTLILPESLCPNGWLLIRQGRIAAVGQGSCPTVAAEVDATAYWVAPGFVDIHVHGGGGADFMDGTEEAFRTVLRQHARHGTTSVVVTTTVARHERIVQVLSLATRAVENEGLGIWSGEPQGARVLGVHLYGPYFGPQAVGCHPAAFLRSPEPGEYTEYFSYTRALRVITLAPELPRWASLAQAALSHGIRVHVGHSNATFDQVAEAVALGATHVDHFFCAMSDKTKLRRWHPYPMRGGVLEATLYFDHLTTEVIADDKHLAPELLKLAYKLKGPDRLALVSDCNRGLDMPDGWYVFGPDVEGQPFLKEGEVCLLPDRTGLASSCVSLAHCLRYFHRAARVSVVEAVRMASLTPARIVGCDHIVGSLRPGRLADFLLLDESLEVCAVFLGGKPLWFRRPLRA